MPDIRLTASSSLERIAVPGRVGSAEGSAGVALAVRANVAVVSVMTRKGQVEQLSKRMLEVVGLVLPAQRRRNAVDAMAFVWAGPGRWLAISNQAAGILESRLRETTAGLASVCDQSDSQVIVQVAGKRARDALAKELMIDLHPRSFSPGDVALTAFGRIPVHMWQTDLEPSYELAVPRSLAEDFWRSLVMVGSEYGVVIEA